MNTKKTIHQLIRNICEGDYASAEKDVSTVIEQKIKNRISKTSKNSKNHKA